MNELSIKGTRLRRLYLRFGVLGLIALFACVSPDGLAQSPWTQLTASQMSPTRTWFPAQFAATAAIAIYDSNANCRIDSYQGAGMDMDMPFPFGLDLNAISPDGSTGVPGTLGSGVAQARTGNHIGSPFSWVPMVSPTGITAGRTPGFCGHILVYAEMQQGSATYYVWFALPDSNLTTPDGYDNSRWGMDYGFGSYTNGGQYISQARNIYSMTFVRDHRATDGDTGNRVGHESVRVTHYLGDGTMENPGHVFSAPLDLTQAWPSAWGQFVAGHLTSNPYTAYFLGLERIVIDVPLVAEENWDGRTLFPTVDPRYGRSIQALSDVPSVTMTDPFCVSDCGSLASPPPPPPVDPDCVHSCTQQRETCVADCRELTGRARTLCLQNCSEDRAECMRGC